jgi:murein DD-endopeptidase MepM/ murein hydrolase activator NlpD
MITNPVDIPSSYAATTANLLTKKSSTASSDLSASFQQILSTMMTSSSMPSADGQSGFGASDLMAPLMLMLLEKMIAQQMDQNPTGTNEVTANKPALINQNTKPTPSGRPVEGVLTQEFHPGHNGLDFGIVVGTPIKTTMDGNVIYAGWNNQGYGNLVIVENGDYRTYYAHLSSVPVAVGDKVSAGATIGLSGNTGNSTGPHLHYEIRKNNVPIDPTTLTLGVSA